MFREYLSYVLLSAFLFQFFASFGYLIQSVSATPATNVIISEVEYNVTGNESEGEWIELYNPTNTVISLSGWTLTEGGGPAYTFTGGVSIDAFSYLIVGNDSTEFTLEHSGKTLDVDMQKTDAAGCFSDGECLRLNNTSDSVVLANDSAVMVDTVEWGAGVWVSLIAAEGKTICRTDIDDTDTAADWTSNCDPGPGSGILNGPANVDADVSLWFKADSGVIRDNPGTDEDVNTWTDQSGNNYNVTQSTDANKPEFIANNVNFNPVVDFNDPMSKGLIGNIASGFQGNQEHSIYIVSKEETVSDWTTFFQIAESTGNLGSTGREYTSYAPSGGHWTREKIWGGMSTFIDTNTNSWTIDSMLAGTGGANTTTVYINNSPADSFQSVSISWNFPSNPAVYLGKSSSQSGVDGKIAEFLVYSKKNSDTERQKIHSYLGLKYGITLSGTGYVNSSGSTVYDLTNGYNQNIVGLGYDESLDQRVSKSENTGTILTLATDNDFTSANGGPRTQMGADTYVVLGSTGATSTGATELPSGYTERLQREWKVQETGTVGALHLKFDGYNAGWDLLEDTDGDFSNATKAADLSSTGIANYNLVDGRYYTLAQSAPSANNTPTNITLSGSSINENVGTGSTVGTLSTTDSDSSDSHSYSFATGTGDTDNGSFTLSGTSLNINLSPDFESKSSYSVRIQTDDGNGGTFQKAFTVSINDLDDIKPIITLVGSGTITQEAGTGYTDQGATWSDNVDGTGGLVASGSVDTSATGSYTLTYDYTDAAGNIANQITRTVNVVDTTAPVITENGSDPVNVVLNGIYSDSGATCVDNYDASCIVASSGSVDISTIGVYTITYTATDATGNVSTETRTVNVQAPRSRGGGSPKYDRCNGNDTSGSIYDGKCSKEEDVKESTKTEEKTKKETSNEEVKQSHEEKKEEQNVKESLQTEEASSEKSSSRSYTLKNNFEKCEVVQNINDTQYKYEKELFFKDASDIKDINLVEKFVSLGVVNGYEDGYFLPGREISRAEFLKFLLKGHCFDYSNIDSVDIDYVDVDKDTWQARVISQAQALGMIDGEVLENGDSIFRPNDIITKIEALKILINISGIQSNREISSGYKDVKEEWHKGYVENAEALELFHAAHDDFSFFPDSGINREEMLDLMSRTMYLYK